jgi:hypothetical protein
MIKTSRFFLLLFFLSLSAFLLIYLGLVTESKILAQVPQPTKSPDLGSPPDSTGTDGTESTPQTNTTTNQNDNGLEFIEFLNSFIGNPEYDVINLPYLLDIYLKKTEFGNSTISCIKTLPILESMKIELTTIDCDDIYIFSKLNSAQINSESSPQSYNKDLTTNMNIYYKIKFLPQLLKNISKSDDFYCLEWENTQIKFDLDLLNCKKFSLLFSPKL